MNHRYYKFHFRCGKCGIWVKKEDAVFIFINHEGKEIISQNPRCPDCHSPLSTRSIKNGNGKLGKDELQNQFILLKQKQEQKIKSKAFWTKTEIMTVKQYKTLEQRVKK